MILVKIEYKSPKNGLNKIRSNGTLTFVLHHWKGDTTIRFGSKEQQSILAVPRLWLLPYNIPTYANHDIKQKSRPKALSNATVYDLQERLMT